MAQRLLSCIAGFAISLGVISCSSSSAPVAPIIAKSSATASASPVALSSTTPSATPLASATPIATATPVASATPVATATPVVSPTPVPTATATASPIPTPTSTYSAIASNSATCTVAYGQSGPGYDCINYGQTQSSVMAATTYQSEFDAGGTNSTDASPSLSSQWSFQSAPPGLSAPGTIIASSSSVLTDTPSSITSTGWDYFFTFEQDVSASEAAPIQTNGESFTCTFYDNGKYMGSASATTAVVSPSSTKSICYAGYNVGHSMLNYYAYIDLSSATFTPGDTLTLIMSH